MASFQFEKPFDNYSKMYRNKVANNKDLQRQCHSFWESPCQILLLLLRTGDKARYRWSRCNAAMTKSYTKQIETIDERSSSSQTAAWDTGTTVADVACRSPRLKFVETRLCLKKMPLSIYAHVDLPPPRRSKNN